MIVNDETLYFELPPYDPTTMEILHDVDDTGCQMFDYVRMHFFLSLNQIVKVLAFDPSAHEVESVLVI